MGAVKQYYSDIVEAVLDAYEKEIRGGWWDEDVLYQDTWDALMDGESMQIRESLYEWTLERDEDMPRTKRAIRLLDYLIDESDKVGEN